MFWGLVLEPSKRYTQKVQQAFHVSQAALELSTSDLEPIQLILDYDGACYVLATLCKRLGIYQVPLDLNFNSGDQISFRTIGKGKVHLAGYHILEDDLDDIALNEDESEIDVGPFTDESENSTSKKQKKRNKNETSKNVKNKKRKLSEKNEVASEDESGEGEEEEDDDLCAEEFSNSDEEFEEEEDEDDEDEEEGEDEEMESGEEQEVFNLPEDDSDDEEEDNKKAGAKKKLPTPSGKNKSDISINGKTPKNKRLNDSMKGSPNKSAKKNASAAGKEAKENKTPKKDKKSPKGEKNKQEPSLQKKVLEGGVIVEDVKLGDGPVAKPGKMVQVYYVGHLQSNKKQFDATTQGPGFKFRLGRGEVIKGWDIGVNGMKVGGKRRITIPSHLAYGPKGAPPAIPPNSVLLFEVDLKGVN